MFNKFIISFLLSIFFIYGFGQSPAPAGYPSPYSTSWYRVGFLQSDSGNIPAYRDTNWIPRFQGTFILWQHAGSDTSFWFRLGNKWVKILKQGDISPAIWGGITGTLSNQTDLQNALNGKLSNITGLIQQGSNVTITGSGTTGNPYIINASGGSGPDSAVNPGLWLSQNIVGTTKTINADSAAMATYFLRRKDSITDYVTPTQLANALPVLQGWDSVLNIDPDFHSNHTSNFGINTWVINESGGNIPLTINSVNNSAIRAVSQSASGVVGESNTGYGGYFQNTPTTTNTTEYVGGFARRTSGTGANGIAGALTLEAQDNTAVRRANSLIWKWTDATDASRTSEFSITTFNNAVEGTVFSLSGDGAGTLGTYGLGNHLGLRAYPLAVTAAGKIIEDTTTSGGGGGSGTVTSVALTTPSFLTTTGSPITTSGTFAITLANQGANLAFGNFTGSSAAPTFGKVPLAAQATNTANYIQGWDGSGNPTALAPDTLFVKNRVSGTGVQVGNISNDTLYLNNLNGSTFVTQTKNTDSSITTSIANSTANTLLGWNGSGIPTNITAGTNINISAGVISATSGGISQIKAGPSPYLKPVGTDSVQFVMDSVANRLGLFPIPFVNSWQYAYDNSWATTTSNGYTISGITATLVGNKLQVFGNGNNYTQVYKKTQQDYYERWTMIDTISINNTISATTYGYGNGFSSFFNNVGWVDLTNGANAGKVSITSGTTVTTSSGAITFSNGDTLIVKTQRKRDTLICTVTNKTNSTTATISHIVSTAFIFGSTDNIHIIGNYAHFVKGGTYIILGTRITLDEQQQPNCIVFGDSKAYGSYVTNWNDRFADRINAAGIRTIDLSSSGDTYASAMLRIQDVLQMHPQQVILQTYRNDLAAGTSLATVIQQYESLKGILESNGIKVWVLTLPEISPSAYVGVTTQFDSAMRQMHPLEYIPAYDAVSANTAGCIYTDGVHLTSVGNDTVSRVILRTFKVNAPIYIPNLPISNPYTTEVSKTYNNLVAIGGNNSFTTSNATSFQVGSQSNIPFDILTNSRRIRFNWNPIFPRLTFYNSAGGTDGVIHMDSLGNIGLGGGIYSAGVPTVSNKDGIVIGHNAASNAVQAGTGNSTIIGGLANNGVSGQTCINCLILGYRSGFYENRNERMYLSDDGFNKTWIYGDFQNGVGKGRVLINPPANGTSPLNMLRGQNFEVNGSSFLRDTVVLQKILNGLSTDSILTYSNQGDSTGIVRKIAIGSGLSISGGILTATGTNIYNTDGTLTGKRVLSGANDSLSFGTSGSKLANLSVWSTGGMNLTGGQYASSGGSQLLENASTINNAVTAASGNVSNFSAYLFAAPTITSTNTGVTYTTPATLRIDNSPTMSTNSTATGLVYALDVAAGISHFGVGGSNFSAILDGTLYINGAARTNTVALGLSASTSSQATLNIPNGVDPSSGGVNTASGNMWYNGTNLNFVDGTSTGVARDLLNGIHNYLHNITTPSTGGTVNLVVNQYNIINPSGTIATLTVNLPSSPNNNDVVYIKYTQAVTAVTYGNGTVVDGIVSPTAGGLVVLTYDSGTTSWY